MSNRSNEELAELLSRIANVSGADAILCATEHGSIVDELRRKLERLPIIAVTPDEETFRRLTRENVETIRMQSRVVDRHEQVPQMLSAALREGRIPEGSLVLCAIGSDVYEDGRIFVVLTEVDPHLQHLQVSELPELTDAVQPEVLAATIDVACTIGRTTRRGKPIGTIITLGDSEKVLEGSRQLVPNPFEGHDRERRTLTNLESHDHLAELAKLDGAFVARRDGFVRAAGVYLASADADDEEEGIDVPAGLGARHAAAAGTTARTAATAVVVSSTDGNVRVFSSGEMVLRVDPEAVQPIPIPTD